MDTNNDDELFFNDLLTQLDPDEVLNQIFLLPLKEQKINPTQEYNQNFIKLKTDFKQLLDMKKDFVLQSRNPLHDYSADTIAANLTPQITSSNNSNNLPIALFSSRSSPVFSTVSSYTRFVQNINNYNPISPPSFILPETQINVSPNILPIKFNKNPLLEFKNYTIPQLKIACQQFNHGYISSEKAIQFLQNNYQKTNKIPQIQLTTFQIMTPQRKNDLEFRLQKSIFDSKYFQSIISFVPIDIRKLLIEIKKNGINISLSFLTDYLITQGILYCDGDREIGEMAEKVNSKISKQLTLSQNLRRKISK